MTPFEHLAVGYLSLLAFIAALYLVFGEREWLGDALVGYCVAPWLVSPLALWLLLDGSWSVGEMAYIGAAMLGVILLISGGQYLHPVHLVRLVGWMCREVVVDTRRAMHVVHTHRRSRSV